MLSTEEKQSIIDLFPFLRENPVVFDVGANKGHWSDVILEEFKDRATIFLFEPNKKLLSFCEIKYEYNSNVKFCNVGLLNEDNDAGKEFYFFENFNNELSSFYQGGKEWEGLPMKKELVGVRKGDTACNFFNVSKIDYLKIDCEGADFETLLGFKQMMTDDNISIIQIEYSAHWSKSGHSFEELKSLCNELGYKIYRYDGSNFWEVEKQDPNFDNYYLTKFQIHNYCISGSNANFLKNTANLPKLNLVIEVGCMEGITTKYICENLLDDTGSSRVIAVDPLNDYYVTDDPRYHPEFKHQYQRFKRNTRGLPVDLMRGKSQDELPKLHALRACMCYIDGNHYPPMPYLDGCWCFAITKIGGYILFDDFLWCDETQANIQKFLDEFIGHYEVIEKSYQVLIKKTSNKYNYLTQPYYL